MGAAGAARGPAAARASGPTATGTAATTAGAGWVAAAAAVPRPGDAVARDVAEATLAEAVEPAHGALAAGLGRGGRAVVAARRATGTTAIGGAPLVRRLAAGRCTDDVQPERHAGERHESAGGASRPLGTLHGDHGSGRYKDRARRRVAKVADLLATVGAVSAGARGLARIDTSRQPDPHPQGRPGSTRRDRGGSAGRQVTPSRARRDDERDGVVVASDVGRSAPAAPVAPRLVADLRREHGAGELSSRA